MRLWKRELEDLRGQIGRFVIVWGNKFAPWKEGEPSEERGNKKNNKSKTFIVYRRNVPEKRKIKKVHSKKLSGSGKR